MLQDDGTFLFDLGSFRDEPAPGQAALHEPASRTPKTKRSPENSFKKVLHLSGMLGTLAMHTQPDYLFHTALWSPRP